MNTLTPPQRSRCSGKSVTLPLDPPVWYWDTPLKLPGTGLEEQGSSRARSQRLKVLSLSISPIVDIPLTTPLRTAWFDSHYGRRGMMIVYNEMEGTVNGRSAVS